MSIIFTAIFLFTGAMIGNLLVQLVNRERDWGQAMSRIYWEGAGISALTFALFIQG